MSDESEALQKSLNEWKEQGGQQKAAFDILFEGVGKLLRGCPDWARFVMQVYGQARLDLRRDSVFATKSLLRIGFLVGWRARNIYEEMKWKTATKQ